MDGTYAGEPLLEIQGQVLFAQDGEAPKPRDASQLRVVVLWMGGHDVGVKVPSLAVQADFPASYSATVFTEPPAEATHAAPDGVGDYALGAVVVFRDLDDDGMWTVGRDRPVGGAPWRAILYSDSGADSPWFGRVGQGYTRMRVAGAQPELACPAGGHVRLEIDPEPALDLSIGEAALNASVFDVNCDGVRTEWAGLCQGARDRGACDDPDSWTCRLCQPLSH